jgi:5-formyltetrahydrofolate cyclo-ligase
MNSVAAIVARKASLRAEALRRRDALAPAARRAAIETIVARALPVELQSRQIVSGYMPIKSEINPIPLMRRYEEAGARLALPAILGRGKALSLRAWSAGERLVSGEWGIREPDAKAQELEPDIMIVPLAAFDRRGSRIGYGAGYYDRTINDLRERKPIVAVGLAFAAQEVDEIPTLPHDARLDLVLTEREVIDCRGA